MSEAKINFDRLNDFNWATWRFRMELMLMKEDLWSIVKESKPVSADITSAWTRKDEKARAMIGLALEDGQLSHIMDAESAKEMWDRLKAYHERGSLSNKIHVLRKLCSLRLDESGSMSGHLVEASELVHRMARMGEPLKEHLVVAILLSSLPESYNPLVTALEGRPEEDLKLEYVKGKLLDDWRRKCETRSWENVSEKVLKSTVQFRNQSSNVWTCHHCGLEGHLWRNCPASLEEKHADVKKRKDDMKAKAVPFLDTRSSGSSRGVCFTTTTGSDEVNKGKWIIDTGCTQHMTGSLRNFTDRTPWREKISLTDGRTVTAKSTGQGRIVGRGSEGETVEINVKGLLYVPGLVGSVLSVSRITDQGYSVVFGPRDCQILKSGAVVAVGTKSDGLYYLSQ